MGPLYDKSKPDSQILVMDWNSLYGNNLMDLLPCGGFEYLADGPNHTRDDILRFPIKGRYGRIYNFDMIIPEDVRVVTDDFPLGLIIADEINPSPFTTGISDGKKVKGRRLIAGHFNLCNYGMHIKLLQFYLQIGCVITKIHSVIEFEQKAFLKGRV